MDAKVHCCFHNSLPLDRIVINSKDISVAVVPSVVSTRSCDSARNVTGARAYGTVAGG